MTAGLIAGGAQGVFGLVGANMQQRASQGMASDMMNFQERMSSTAHQREVKDLRDAGLNPVLSALGNGSSTPTGAMGEATNQGEPLGQGIASGVATANAMKAMAKDFEAKDATIANQKADTTNKGAQTAGILNQNASTAKDIEAKEIANKINRETAPALIKKLKAEGKYAEAAQVMGIVSAGASTAKDVTEIGTNLLGGGVIKNAVKGAVKGMGETVLKGQFGH